MANSQNSLRHGWRLLLALVLSLLIHAWLIGGLDGWLQDDESSGATLIKVELMPPPAPSPLVKPHPELPKPARRAPPVKAKPAPSQQPSAPATEMAPVTTAPSASETVPASAPEPATPAAPAALEPLAEGPIEEPVAKAPSRVVIDYQIMRKGGVAAKEHHEYQTKEDGSYTLSSLVEAKGLLALALSDLLQKSQGQVTAHGLRPATYVYQYGKNPDKAQRATFDWESKTLLMEAGKSRQQVELVTGTQDLMSFMYQFMFVPPLQEMHLVLTNGKKLKVYNYNFEGEETLQTNMGPLQTLRIGKSNSDGEEKTEIWLAADYHYLPVKISQTEKDGTVTERIATHLLVEP